MNVVNKFLAITAIFLICTSSYAQTATAKLSWDVPTLRENGDELLSTEIGGYEIVYKKTSESVYKTIIINSNTVSTHEINGLPPAEYEFRAAVFDSDGLYSDFSDPVVAVLKADKSRPGGINLTVDQGGDVVAKSVADIINACGMKQSCTVVLSVSSGP
jgi:hypothetical protein